MLLELKHVSKTYEIGDTVIRALDGISLGVAEKEFVAIMGPSGSGKSTFLQVASMLAEPSSGEIFLSGQEVSSYNEIQRAHLRNKQIGFVFQSFNLLARTSALENVMLPLFYAGYGADSSVAREKAKVMLERVGLGNRLSNTPAQLSGGQQQRVAIARALINDPTIIFADEPTGNLDSKSGEDIKQILRELNQEGKTIIMVTHEDDVAAIAKRQIVFRDGKVLSDSAAHHKSPTISKAKKQKGRS
jgi:putative ABC transport system ATP-binding protein